ncbi:putative transcription factor Hap3/NF-YB family [Rosa chinensis]|uniref:Histone H2A n=1 Tax=Rosa chinensis TaxID=74649 RepID=A0A2P6P6T1_ROSCH|nr:putative transcription factor Hap3/NF-YB family [Rosa chinensis]
MGVPEGSEVPAGGRKGDGSKKKAVTQSVKAGLQFLVGRIGRYLKKGRYAQCVNSGAPVYLATCLSTLQLKLRSSLSLSLCLSCISKFRLSVLELSGNVARGNKKNMIIPRHLLLAVRNDKELGFLLGLLLVMDWRFNQVEIKQPEMISHCIVASGVS